MCKHEKHKESARNPSYFQSANQLTETEKRILISRKTVRERERGGREGERYYKKKREVEIYTGRERERKERYIREMHRKK